MNHEQTYIRVATGLDREKLRAMFARSSPETVYRRLHAPYPEAPEWMVAADHHDKEPLIAVAEEKIVDHAMYVRLGDHGEAEMAIIVEDGWQSMGVGKSLLSELGGRAERRGIEAFTAEVLATNRPMLGLADMFAGTHHTTEDGAYHVRMPLQAPAVFAPQAVRHAAQTRTPGAVNVECAIPQHRRAGYGDHEPRQLHGTTTVAAAHVCGLAYGVGHSRRIIVPVLDDLAEKRTHL